MDRPALVCAGVRQAEAVGAGLEADAVDAVYASPLTRALETGRAIAGHHGLEVQVLAELREIELFRDLPEGMSLFDALDPLLLRGVRERFAGNAGGTCIRTARLATSSDIAS